MSKYKITDTATPSERRMSYISEDVLETLQKFIQIVDKNLSIGEIDYGKGEIKVAMTYNRGTPDEWVEQDFIVVNVNADSVPAACHDVYTKVYDRCR